MELIAAVLRQSLGEGTEMAEETQTNRMPWEIEMLPIGISGRVIPYKVLPDGRKYAASEEDVRINDHVFGLREKVEALEAENAELKETLATAQAEPRRKR